MKKKELEKLNKVITELVICAEQVRDLIQDTKEQSKEIPFVPKRGDFVKENNGERTLLIHSLFESESGDMCVRAMVVSRKHEIDFYNGGISCGWLTNFRLATDQEKQLLIDKLHEAGKHFDEEKMEIVDWKWRAEKGERYFMYSSKLDKTVEFTDYRDVDDFTLFESGNYFRTESEAQKFQEHCKSYFKK